MKEFTLKNLKGVVESIILFNKINGRFFKIFYADEYDNGIRWYEHHEGTCDSYTMKGNAKSLLKNFKNYLKIHSKVFPNDILKIEDFVFIPLKDLKIQIV